MGKLGFPTAVQVHCYENSPTMYSVQAGPWTRTSNFDNNFGAGVPRKIKISLALALGTKTGADHLVQCALCEV